MRKLELTQLARLSVEQHRLAPKLPVTIILDNLRSQHNIGSIFRTADAFRFEAIYLCGLTATPPHREIHKTALGATESVDWKYFEHTIAAIHELKNKGYNIIGVEQTSGSISLESFRVSEARGLGIIFGNEISGVDQQAIDLADNCIEIPQFGTKHSLNVAVSAGIVLWEVFQQMRNKLNI